MIIFLIVENSRIHKKCKDQLDFWLKINKCLNQIKYVNLKNNHNSSSLMRSLWSNLQKQGIYKRAIRYRSYKLKDRTYLKNSHLETRVGDESCVILEVGYVTLNSSPRLQPTYVLEWVDKGVGWQEHRARFWRRWWGATYNCHDRYCLLSTCLISKCIYWVFTNYN